MASRAITADANDEVRAAPPLDLRTFALAALADRASGNGLEPDTSPESRFLMEHLDRASGVLSRGRNEWSQGLTEYLRNPSPRDAPLVQLAAELGLHAIECLAISLAAEVETNVMVGRAVAHLQSPLGGSRPTLGLLAAAFGEFSPSLDAMDLLVGGVAVQCGLLTLLNDGPPLAERLIAVPVPLCLALGRHDAVWPGATVGLSGTPEVPLPSSISEEIRRQARGLSAGTQRVLVVRTGSVAEGRSIASAIAGGLGGRALFIHAANLTAQPSRSSPALQASGLVPFLLLQRLLPVFCHELGPGERKTLPALPHYHGPILALCGPDGSIEAAGETASSWRVAVPPREERQILWQKALGSQLLANDLASQHRHGCGRIAQLGRAARHQSLLDGRAGPQMSDVVAASWVSEGSGLEALAQPLPDPIPDEAMVMTAALQEELERLLRRCRARDGLVHNLGASAIARYRPGVCALFLGPSGTGKTLAAGWLATQLGLPLYRVDLAAVTSKYIGETEKNLSQLLARAEQSEVVLLFDEADSLFGKRTEVKEANDRFANAQTNYLLQRIENFDGVTILTSNSRARFDSAFARRLDMIIEFPPPGAEERRSLWQSHLGTNHRLTQRELNQLSATADLFGGHIRNAVLSSAVLAQAEGRPIEYRDLYDGLVAEFRKLGRQVPVGLAPKT